MNKRFLIVLLVCVLALIGVYVATSKKDPGSADKNGSGSSVSLSNNVMGANTKGVTLVEYGDFQCPACGAYHPIVKEVVEKYKNDIQFQFRNFPLQQIHPNARAAARTAEAAGKQGKYWEMHNLLYEQQKSWEQSTAVNTIFEGYAQQLGLNLEKFKTDFASSSVNETINADFAEGQRLGVEATPTFFLQGKKIENSPRDVEGFSKLIDEAIKQAQTQKQ
jgi:protein-disulfide isomerase